MPDGAAIARLRAEKQLFFLPFYLEVVASHPLGVASEDAKAQVQRLIISRYGFDPFDPAITGTNQSTGLSAASQWANNLVSNRILDREMTVVREGRATLYPWISVGAPRAPSVAGGPSPLLDDALRRAAADRTPRSVDSHSRQYLRCPALAEFVRQDANYRCIIDSAACLSFPSRTGQPYVEAHHILPMHLQAETSYNLDRYENMVALCVRCHAFLHRGRLPDVALHLKEILQQYEARRGTSFTMAMSSSRLQTDTSELIARY